MICCQLLKSAQGSYMPKIGMKNYCPATEERECSDCSDSASWYCPQCYTHKTIQDGKSCLNNC